jgi:starvation-inducible outer membrane lipoprotein
MKKYTILFLFLLLSGCATISKNLEVDVNNDFHITKYRKLP